MYISKQIVPATRISTMSPGAFTPHHVKGVLRSVSASGLGVSRADCTFSRGILCISSSSVIAVSPSSIRFTNSCSSLGAPAQREVHQHPCDHTSVLSQVYTTLLLDEFKQAKIWFHTYAYWRCQDSQGLTFCCWSACISIKMGQGSRKIASVEVQHCHISPLKVAFITQDDTQSLCGRKRPSQVTCLTCGHSENNASAVP